MMQARQSTRWAKLKWLASRSESKRAHSRRRQDPSCELRSGLSSEGRARFGVRFVAAHCLGRADSKRTDGALYVFAYSCSASVGRVYLEARPLRDGNGRNVSSGHAR
jgi:hypothetical protein